MRRREVPHSAVRDGVDHRRHGGEGALSKALAMARIRSVAVAGLKRISTT
jgi:hypothetical protein